MAGRWPVVTRLPEISGHILQDAALLQVLQARSQAAVVGHDGGPDRLACGVDKDGAVVEATHAYRRDVAGRAARLGEGLPDRLAATGPPCPGILLGPAHRPGQGAVRRPAQAEERAFQVKEGGFQAACPQVNSQKAWHVVLCRSGQT